MDISVDELQLLKKISGAKSFEIAQLQAKLKASEGKFFMTVLWVNTSNNLTLFDAQSSAKGTLLIEMQAKLTASESKFHKLQGMNEASNTSTTICQNERLFIDVIVYKPIFVLYRGLVRTGWEPKKMSRNGHWDQ